MSRLEEEDNKGLCNTCKKDKFTLPENNSTVYCSNGVEVDDNSCGVCGYSNEDDSYCSGGNDLECNYDEPYSNNGCSFICED